MKVVTLYFTQSDEKLALDALAMKVLDPKVQDPSGFLPLKKTVDKSIMNHLRTSWASVDKLYVFKVTLTYECWMLLTYEKMVMECFFWADSDRIRCHIPLPFQPTEDVPGCTVTLAATRTLTKRWEPWAGMEGHGATYRW